MPFAQTPAQAADSFTCSGPASFFNNNTSGLLYHRTLTNPLTTTYSWSGATDIGKSGWTFGRMLGGPNGRVYAINSAGLTRFRWTGTTWEQVDGKINWLLSSSFTGYATSAFRDKITVDEAGDFYLIDGNGILRWYRFDEPSRKWVISGKALDTGWDKYNLVVATSPGVLYARLAADGTLHRYRFDPATERWLMRDKLVGSSGWAAFTRGLFSAGGDSVFGIQSNGDLYQYRYREDTGTWPVLFQKIGSGWNFPNVFATTNTCHQGGLTSPVKPSTPTVANAPLSAMQAPPAPGATLGTVEYAYTDNIGRLVHGRQTDPDSFSSVQWTPVSGADAHTGKPALIADYQGRINLYGHQTNSDIRPLSQTAPGALTWNAWGNLAGGMRSEPSVVRLSDDSLAVFALDTDGALWARPQNGRDGDLLPWTKLGGTGLTGTPVVDAGLNGTATVTAIDSTGAVVTATYQNRALTAPFASIGGGTGFAGTPAVVVMPGRRAMVFARHSDGTIKKQYQNTDGTWPGTWTLVGTGTITPAGNPAAILDPNLGRILVVTRTTENSIYNAWETGQGTETWGTWTLNGGEGLYGVDPTAFSYQASGGTRLAFVSRTLNGTVVPFVTDASVLTRTAAPRFSSVKIPQPKK
ncbi:tachylectin-related carbohydrate-binding protein [Micromonospora sp. AMSO31t]|uniref:tachylectin-related carbohydrate-binding protein n=1 Tax=Micromonospora sp. AMSO31t TaxID=2650566 RepID=UPI001CEC972D|nr:tachylectin-related carbohydrate-binding protein [Micromonospora sp. AMSO31t]